MLKSERRRRRGGGGEGESLGVGELKRKCETLFSKNVPHKLYSFFFKKALTSIHLLLVSVFLLLCDFGQQCTTACYFPEPTLVLLFKVRGIRNRKFIFPLFKMCFNSQSAKFHSVIP